MTVWSCTPFCDELDVLEIRLETLDPVVDRHVLVEATVTQSGKTRRPVFEAHQDRFAQWLPKIDYVLADFLPEGDDRCWDREHAQRDACLRAMGALKDDDLVFLSDVDEIPDPGVFGQAEPLFGPVWVGMAMHLYCLNWRWTEKPVMGGTRAVFVSGAMLEQKPSYLVETALSWVPGVNGWHLAYQGGVEAIQRKLAALADFRSGPLALGWQPHWDTDEHLWACLEHGTDIFDRQERQCEWVGLGELPPYVQENAGRFAHMLIDEPVRLAA